MRSSLVTLLFVSAIVLAACGGPSADLEYLDSRAKPNLEIPPDLTLVKVDSDFELPAIFSADGTGSGNKIPVLASVESIKLKGHSDFYWLSIDESAENLYQLVKEFWASEGFTLAMDEPVIGIMKTHWVFNKEGGKDEDKSFLAKIFGSNELASSQDQFITRIARDGGTATSQIYISHRGTEYEPEGLLATSKNDDDRRIDWKFRASEPELEVEMLSRLMLYLGLRQLEVDQQLAKIKLFAPRASIHTDYAEDETYILVKDEITRTWYRTLHQIERLNLEVISADLSKRLTSITGVMLVETDIEIEVDTSGFFSFSPNIEIVKMQVKLVVSEESHEITRISMETTQGDTENSAEGVEFLTLLYQYMK
ncbi:MAG: outer membrane protein assembly factor BamC [Gammaproteobacteria bacterium]|nr:MAG: outer membrane protein assembly factor BamC [Gammaproteobacteria bacterium]